MSTTFGICLEEIEKRAVSSAATLRLLQGRVAQGARVAPGIMAHAAQQAASGVAHTTPALRNVALEAGSAARLQQQARAIAPVKAPLQARIAKAEGMGHGQFDYSKPRKTTSEGHVIYGDAFGDTHHYSQGAMNTMTASPATIADPKGLMAAAPKKAPASTAVTAVTRKGAPLPKPQVGMQMAEPIATARTVLAPRVA
jgi:hypothetical protein